MVAMVVSSIGQRMQVWLMSLEGMRVQLFALAKEIQSQFGDGSQD